MLVWPNFIILSRNGQGRQHRFQVFFSIKLTKQNHHIGYFGSVRQALKAYQRILHTLAVIFMSFTWAATPGKNCYICFCKH
jgi:hypothetical protein